MNKVRLFLFLIICSLGFTSCKKLCMHCNCNFNTQENFEEEDCTSGLGDESTKIQEYDTALKAEKGYTYCDCYGVKR